MVGQSVPDPVPVLFVWCGVAMLVVLGRWMQRVRRTAWGLFSVASLVFCEEEGFEGKRDDGDDGE